MTTPCRILVVDDEQVSRDSLAAWLKEDGHQVDTASSGPVAVALARATDYALYFIDLRLPGINGLQVMAQIRDLHPEASVVIITAFATVDTAVDAMKQGAEDYLVKPFNPHEISLLVERLIEVRNIRRENIYLRKKLTGQYSYQDIISKNSKMQEIFALVRDAANLRSTVLIQGESGTGKELIARALHYAGDRKNHPFIAVSCAALSESLLESELFGHERGAFTGAVGRKPGKFESADGGTLFLDEIGDITPKLQADLLRVLQERSFFRLGGTEEVRVDVRIIAATNQDLAASIAAGDFRHDLFYRLNVINIRVPPLRDRREDIPLLADQFRERQCIDLRKTIHSISPPALRLLMDHDWPGNVRELENAVERAMIACHGPILDEEDFRFLHDYPTSRLGWSVPTDLSLQELEKQVIAAVLRRTGGNVKEAAGILGIDRSTLYDKIKRYDLR